MKKPTRRDALLATAAIGAVAATRAKAQTALALESAPMSDVIQALGSRAGRGGRSGVFFALILGGQCVTARAQGGVRTLPCNFVQFQGSR
jgi:hypothetical protein